MEDYYGLEEPQGYNVTTSSMRREEEPQCSSLSWLWIVLLFIAIGAIIGLIIWIVWLYRHRDSKDKEVGFKDPNITVSSNSSITGTWTSTTNSDDEVKIWATLNPPKIKPDGSLDTTRSPQTATGTSVTLPGLTPGLKYFATLTVTNKHSSNYQVFTKIVFMQVAPLLTNVNFAIEDMLQVGRVQLVSGGDIVQFSQTPTQSNDALWVIKPSSSQIENVGDSTKCLAANASGVLVAVECSSQDATIITNSSWTYTSENQWCLKSTTGSTTAPTCMVLTQLTGTGSGSVPATINVNNTSTTTNNGFVNVFETA